MFEFCSQARSADSLKVNKVLYKRVKARENIKKEGKLFTIRRRHRLACMFRNFNIAFIQSISLSTPW